MEGRRRQSWRYGLALCTILWQQVRAHCDALLAPRHRAEGLMRAPPGGAGRHRPIMSIAVTEGRRARGDAAWRPGAVYGGGGASWAACQQVGR